MFSADIVVIYGRVAMGWAGHVASMKCVRHTLQKRTLGVEVSFIAYNRVGFILLPDDGAVVIFGNIVGLT
jgi:uncharacterized membrane protein YsdA (DUF1294 family)